MAYTACKIMNCDLAGGDLKVSFSENTPYGHTISKRSHFDMIPELQWSFLTIVSIITLNACWTVCTGCQETTRQTLAFMSLWWPVNFPNKGPALRKAYQCHDVITKPVIYGNWRPRLDKWYNSNANWLYNLTKARHVSETIHYMCICVSHS